MGDDPESGVETAVEAPREETRSKWGSRLLTEGD